MPHVNIQFIKKFYKDWTTSIYTIINIHLDVHFCRRVVKVRRPQKRIRSRKRAIELIKDSQ